MSGRELTNYGMNKFADPSATDHNRYYGDHADDPMDGGGFLPLLGVEPWDGRCASLVGSIDEPGPMLCWVCKERPQVTEGVRGLAVCCMCARASTDGHVEYYGEPAGSNMNWWYTEKGKMTKQQEIEYLREAKRAKPKTKDEAAEEAPQQKVAKFQAKVKRAKARMAG